MIHLCKLFPRRSLKATVVKVRGPSETPKTLVTVKHEFGFGPWRRARFAYSPHYAEGYS